MRQLLSDVTVVELSQDAAGSQCAKVFADLGARVVKVEPRGGSPLRARPAAFLQLNTNKRSTVVDTESPHATDRVTALLAAADVVVQSLGHGELRDYGLSLDDVREEFPGLVIASISGFGAEGPYADYRWTDLVNQTVSWFVYPMGPSSARPLKLPGIAGLCAVGNTAALGALAGVLRARASGEGAHVDCAAYEALGTIPARVGRYLGWEYADRRPPATIPTSSSGMLFPTGIFPAGDGFMALMSTPQQLNEMLDVLDDDDLRAAFAHPDALARGDTREFLDLALYPWLMSHTRAELTAQAQAVGWPAAGVLSVEEVLEVDHFHQRAFWEEVEEPTTGRTVWLPGAPYRHREGGWRLRRPAPALGELDTAGDAAIQPLPIAARGRTLDPSAPPLDGVRVLDLTTVWSGPYLTQLLADLGAEVIRVENPSSFPPTTKGYVPRPETTGTLGALLNAYAPLPERVEDRPYNRHALNNSIARNKLSCTLDPLRDDARALLFDLVEQSDVFVENLKASTLHHLGIQEGELLDRNPRLIVLRIPPAGLTGDWAHYTGFGLQFDGLSGVASLNGHPGTDLTDTPPTTYMDAVTGPAGCFAILAALHFRDATGRGQVIELAQIENAIQQIGDLFVAAQLGDTPTRQGNRDPLYAPQGVYPGAGDTQWIAISVADDDEWRALVGVMGRPELLDDPRFITHAARYAKHDELDRIISEWTVTQHIVETFHTLQRAGVAAGAQLDEEMLVADANIAARGWIRPLDTAEVGTYPHIGHAFRGLPMTWRRGAPSLGEDNEYVYKKLLGLDDDAYARLEAAGIAIRDYLDENGNPV